MDPIDAIIVGKHFALKAFILIIPKDVIKKLLGIIIIDQKLLFYNLYIEREI